MIWQYIAASLLRMWMQTVKYSWNIHNVTYSNKVHYNKTSTLFKVNIRVEQF